MHDILNTLLQKTKERLKDKDFKSEKKEKKTYLVAEIIPN